MQMDYKRGIIWSLCVILILCATAKGERTTPAPPSSPSCQNVTCPANQACQMVEVQCIRAPCERQPSCVNVSCTALTGCSLVCSNGKVRDSSGCETCQCVCGPEPCQGLVCLYGRATDSEGCNICDCNDPCFDMNCPNGQQCQVTKNSTSNTYFGQCVAIVTRAPCPVRNCATVCRLGYASDINGCQTCDCYDPCQGYPCPANQRCMLTADDCPAGSDCRDGPMPYCVDNTNTTTTQNISPTTTTTSSSTTTPAAIANRDDAALQECCIESGISDACLPLCSTNITLLYSSVETLSGCFQYLGNLLKCASGGRSFDNCCVQRGVSESCLFLCSGDDNIDTSNPHSVTQCIVTSISSVIGCFKTGIPDANVTATSTTTPSTSTMEDICSLPPVIGPCRAAMTRWYYSPKDRACDMFSYGGCQGNGNNFNTKDECLARCANIGNVCPELMCPSTCKITIDDYGCHACRCGNNCLSDGCPPGQQCLMMPGTCAANATNCPLVPRCVAQPDVICNPPLGCNLTCPGGWMTDTTGCPICQCKTCPVFHCPAMFCLYGVAKSADGCATCQCLQPCQNMSCPDQCRVVKDNTTNTYYGQCYSTQSTTAPSGLSSTSRRPVCPEVMCMMLCTYGFEKDANGCEVCTCRDPCKNCTANQTCQMMSVDCPTSDSGCSSSMIGLCIDKVPESTTTTPMIPTTTTARRCLLCMMRCMYGMMTDQFGCAVCHCYDPCEGLNCAGNSTCQVLQTDCQNCQPNATYIGECVAATTTVVTTVLPTSSPTIRICPMCAMMCPYGNVKDTLPNGCPVCRCNEPCSNVTCGNNEKCQVTVLPNNTYGTQCVAVSSSAAPSTPTTSPTMHLCPMCAMMCPYGNVKDTLPNGCPVCRCNEPCSNVTCGNNERCQVTVLPNNTYGTQCVAMSSSAAPSTRTPRVTPTGQVCPPICLMYCPYGMLRDPSGCEICKCNQPCQNVTCSPNQQCQPTMRPNGTTYTGECMTVTTTPVACPRVACRMACDYGMMKDANGCDICSCFVPCQNVSCPTNVPCLPMRQPDGTFKGQCVGVTSTVGLLPTSSSTSSSSASSSTPTTQTSTRGHILCAPGPLCLLTCPFGKLKDANGCELCQCAGDPCNNITCNATYACVHTTVMACQEDMCSNVIKGVCQYSCQPMKDCMLSNDCTYGLVKDTNGCNTCKCLDPCQNMTCSPGYECAVRDQPLCTNGQCSMVPTGYCTLSCPSMANCSISCQYGYVKNETGGCKNCQCFDPCEGFNCDAGQVCVVSTAPIYTGNPPERLYMGQCTSNCPQMSTCTLACDYGFVKDVTGCPICQCYDPCLNLNCSYGQYCTRKLQSDGKYQYVAICEACPTPMCQNSCFYGYTQNPSTGCNSCNCLPDPCSTQQCSNPNQICQSLLYCPGSTCKPTPVCLDPLRPCDSLQQQYQNSFSNSLDKSPQLNCDSQGMFKPIQCFGSECYCVTPNGTATSDRSINQINCYSGQQINAVAKIQANINIIKPGDGWRFKEVVSQQIANFLGIDESLVTVTKYVNGSIITDLAIGGMDKLNQAEFQPFNIVYDNNTYTAIILSGSTSLSTPGPFVTSPHRVPNEPNVEPEGGDGSVLMIILICVFAPIAFIAIIGSIWCGCKIVRNERMLPVKDSKRLSSVSSTEINSLESGSEKGYKNPNDQSPPQYKDSFTTEA